jgi:hypothetical protein
MRRQGKRINSTNMLVALVLAPRSASSDTRRSRFRFTLAPVVTATTVLPCCLGCWAEGTGHAATGDMQEHGETDVHTVR